ncbi:hypothetical protein D3C81_1050970 [compost metagenome]
MALYLDQLWRICSVWAVLSGSDPRHGVDLYAVYLVFACGLGATGGRAAASYEPPENPALIGGPPDYLCDFGFIYTLSFMEKRSLDCLCRPRLAGEYALLRIPHEISPGLAAPAAKSSKNRREYWHRVHLRAADRHQYAIGLADVDRSVYRLD